MADRISYVWDRLIDLFVKNAIEGTSVPVLGQAASPSETERGLRAMALETRFSRRILGDAVASAIQACEKGSYNRFARVMIPDGSPKGPKMAYILMILAYPVALEKEGNLPGGYEQYRAARTQMLQAYCMVLLYERRNITTVVGIAMDATFRQTGKEGGSEELIALQAGEWTADFVKQILEDKERYSILLSDRLVQTHRRHYEYPTRRPST